MRVDFQSKAYGQGDMFGKNCIMALQMAGFEIVEYKYRIESVGIELDAIANGSNGQGYAFEFKGSWNINRPGAMRTDTLKKAIANGVLFLEAEEAEVLPPIIVMTSHMPENGAGRAMLEIALRKGWFLDVISDRDGARLQWFSQAIAEDIETLLASRT